MKIVELDLQAFGMFTGETLSLEAGQEGLHVVYGANEAGKSTALRALRALLYGIFSKTKDNFIHEYRDLRIGGTLRRADGTELECIRRKGSKNTLLRPADETPLDDHLLAAMLGGVDETAFRRRHGIDYDELVAGGKAIAEGSGDLGQVLFAAASGVAGLGAVQASLKAEAEALFKSTAKVLPINAAIKSIKQKRKDRDDAQLPTAEWVGHDQALREANGQRDSLDDAIRAARSQQQRLERIDQALPLIGRRQGLLEELETLADAPRLPEDFSETRRTAISALTVAENAQRDASREIAELDKKLQQMEVPESLLAEAERIEALHKRLGSPLQGAQDRPILLIQCERLEADAQQILQHDLRHDIRLDEAVSLRLAPAEQVRIQNLGNEQQALVGRLDTARSTWHKLVQRIEQAHQDQQALPQPRDVSPLEQALRRARQRGDLSSQHADLTDEEQQLLGKVHIELTRMKLWSGSLEALEQLTVPSPETVDRFDKDLAAAAGKVERLDGKLQDSQDELRDHQHRLESLQREHDVPDEAQLATIRQCRDAGWKLVRQAWQQGKEAAKTADFVAQFPPAANLAEAFQHSLQQADQLADRLRSEADRVARKAGLQAECEKLLDQSAQVETQRDDARGQLQSLQNQWWQAWQSLGAEPQSPSEMRAWLRSQESLLNRAAALRELRGRVEQTAGQMREHGLQLRACLAALNEPLPEEAATWQQLLDHCQQTADQVNEIERQRGQLASQLAADQLEQPEARRATDEAEQALATWSEQWAEVMRHLALRPNAQPAEANAVLAAIGDLLGKLGEANDKRSRIAEIDQNAGQFAGDVRSLLKSIAPQWVDRPPEETVPLLNRQLVDARKIQTERTALQRQRERETGKVEDAGGKVRSAEATLQTLCKEAKCNAADDLPEAERRSARRRELDSQCRDVEEQLLRLAAGTALETFIADAATEDADGLKPRIEELGERLASLDTRKSEVLQTIGQQQTKLAQMDGSARAAELGEEVEDLRTKILADAEQYIRLRLASAVLRQAIERYRESHQGPVLQRASELFSELTLGSFTGLRADYNDRDQAVLLGVRPGGVQTLDVDAMSEGTRDQLYLALRLASLEAQPPDREPLPFIVDDILIKFDDDRAVAALKALARLSQQMQVVFFTHHEHLLRLAGENIDDDVLFVHRLGEPSRQVVSLK